MGFLFLTRRKDQQILIGSNIIVTVGDIRGDHVRIGISAPRDIPVHRREVAERIAAENVAAKLKQEQAALAGSGERL